MEHYVGLDVSLKLTAICIVDRTGKIQREGVVHSDPEAIAAFIKSNAPHVARIGAPAPAQRAYRSPPRAAASLPHQLSCEPSPTLSGIPLLACGIYPHRYQRRP